MNILICDDEQFYIDKIIERINEYTPKEYPVSIFSYKQRQEIIENIDIRLYDIAFLDIELDDCNGIQLANQLQILNPHCIIIFITNYPQYVTEAFHLNTYQYLLKPLDEDTFLREYRHVLDTYSKIQSKCYFNTNEGKILFHPLDIMYIETYYHEIRIVTTNRVFLSDIKNKDHIIKSLENHDFIKIHQSFYVNLNYVSVVHRNHLILYNREHLPISIPRRNYVKKAFQQFIVRDAYPTLIHSRTKK